MQLDIVTPERQLLSAEVKSVQIPATEGEMTVMGDHSPVITTLRPGIVSVATASETSEFVVTGGFAEISSAGASILAEHAIPREEATAEMFATERAATEAASAVADGPEKARLSLRLNDLSVLATRLGL
ncbi:MAG: ATP synthase F1 subunit epsilon [Pseudomonadota bacterium]